MAPTNNPLSCETRLTEANWSEVYKLLKNDMMCFGEAGQEILTGISFNQKFPEPISGPTISERVMQDGAIVTVERPTEKGDRTLINKRHETWERDVKDYVQQSGALWSYLMKTLEPEMDA